MSLQEASVNCTDPAAEDCIRGDGAYSRTPRVLTHARVRRGELWGVPLMFASR